MTEKIFEVRIVHVNHMPPQARDEVIREVASKPPAFRNNYRGFAKVTYVTASPPRISKVEAIEGTIVNHFDSIGGDFSVF